MHIGINELVRLGVRDSIVLYEHEIKEELRDQRFGIKAYHHPGVLEALSATAPETQLLQEIDKAELPKLGKLPVNTQLATYCKIWKD